MRRAILLLALAMALLVELGAGAGLIIMSMTRPAWSEECTQLQRVIEYDTVKLKEGGDDVQASVERRLKGMEAANFIASLLRLITPPSEALPDTPQFDEVVVLKADPLPGRHVILLRNGCVVGGKGFPASLLSRVDTGA